MASDDPFAFENENAVPASEDVERPAATENDPDLVERVLEALEDFHFEESAIAHLDSLGIFKAGFLDFLRKLRFTGTVRAIREWRLFFVGEIVLEVRAPLIEAQII